VAAPCLRLALFGTTKPAMKVLVTGASGFLGSHVAEQLSSEGHTVRALVRKTSNRKFLETLEHVEFAEGSVEQTDRVDEAVKGVDAIVHAAGLVKARSEDEFRATNVGGTRNVLEAAKRHAPRLQRFVFVSSLAAAGPSADGTPLRTDVAPHPVTHYGKSKLEAERLVVAAKDALKVTVLRPPALYGPRDNEIFAVFKAVDKGLLPTIGGPSNTLSMLYGADCAAACIRAIFADVPSGSVYFVDDGRVYRLREMLEGVEGALGKKALVRVNLPMSVVYLAALGTEVFGKLTNRAVMLTRDKVNEIRQPHWVCDSEDTRRALGWTPRVMLDEGTRLTARWYRDNGWL
jgi:nucleoside-diphosphate-sugar epimerase